MFIYVSACIVLNANESTMRIIDQSANESWKKVSKARIVAPTKVVYFQKFSVPSLRTYCSSLFSDLQIRVKETKHICSISSATYEVTLYIPRYV
ncbi:hypothetical protein Krac_11552 [Ktedonobacter racemifer DSM 44963]|uniref:Uncharacterized protein n=1 Tax=Ktedonobacter racemifer DSM 44963 TaxID=485913 RepID=D6TCE5_KTERA|nr:hypothetical protein Krac_11552 [Ktedonobacter racemifer DSM 44963]